MLQINPVIESTSFRVHGVWSARPQKRAIQFEKEISGPHPERAGYGKNAEEHDSEKLQWYLEDTDGTLSAICSMVSFDPFTPVSRMPFPLRYLLSNENFAQLRGEQIHFVSRLLLARERQAPEMVKELICQIHEYCTLCAPGVLIQNLDKLDLVTQFVIEGWQVYCKCQSDPFGDHHTVLLGREATGELATEP